MDGNSGDGNGRKPVTFNIKEDLIKEFSKVCEEKGLIMSRRIEKCIQEEIERIRKMGD
nr:hypothetical protein [Candidatus Woesearchaeota archaeon]